MSYNLKKFGDIIRIERLKRKYSQEKLAEKVDCSARTISLIESGLQHPKFFLVVKIANVLGFYIKELI